MKPHKKMVALSQKFHWISKNLMRSTKLSGIIPKLLRQNWKFPFLI